MAHNIMDNNKFFGYRTPAWHSLGTVCDDSKSVIEVAGMLDIPNTFMGDVFDSFGNPIKNSQAIHTRHSDGRVFTHGIVSKNRYHLVGHLDVLGIAHDVVSDAPVETMGLLGDGGELFCTFKLPEFRVKDDALKPFLMLYNPLDGLSAIRARNVVVRVVCQNTVMIALGEKTEHFLSLKHTKNAKDKIREWLAGVWLGQSEAVSFMESYYTRLYDTDMHASAIDGVLSLVYPDPSAIDESKASTDEMLAYISKKDRATTDRATVCSLMHNSPSLPNDAKGTAYGLLQSVVEYEDFLRPYHRASSSVFGAGADRKNDCNKALAAYL